MSTNYLDSAIRQLQYYRMLGEKAICRIPDERLHWQFNSESNSAAVIIKHLSGNMLSRWTDFLAADGEKEWRNRDQEFENSISSRDELMKMWSSGWDVCLQTLMSLTEDDLGKTIYIRNQGHTVMEAINRQLAHYPYHVGQLVFIGKMCTANWESLSIPKGASRSYNDSKFQQPHHREHFTDEYLNDSTQSK